MSSEPPAGPGCLFVPDPRLLVSTLSSMATEFPWMPLSRVIPCPFRPFLPNNAQGVMHAKPFE